MDGIGQATRKDDTRLPATVLLHELIQRARARGLSCLRAEFLERNSWIAEVLRRSGLVVRQITRAAGVVEAEIDLRLLMKSPSALSRVASVADACNLG
jgi:hypothetical protein